jgi:DNA polymerase-3 subunit beta
MKFSANRDVLCDALHAVGGGVGNAQTMPILGNVLLTAKDGELELATTNLDFAVGCAVAASVSKTGSSTLPARKLTGICRAIDSDIIDLELLSSGNSVRISGGGSVFRLTALPPSDFPSLPQIILENQITLKAEALSRAMNSVDYAQSRDEHRQVLNGTFFQLEDGVLALVATDGRRLARSTVPCNGGDWSFILPARSATELLRLVEGGTDATLSGTGRQVSFSIFYGETGKFIRSWLVSKVVDGNYPNYRQVIPSTPVHRLVLQRETFLAALSRAALMGGAAPAVQIKFSENLVELSASNGEFGDAYERIAAVAPSQTPVEISFNPRYLIEPLRARSSPEVAFEFRDSLSPGVLRSDDDFLCVVMPLRSGS